MKRVLIVDDDLSITALLQRRLEADGFKVSVASNGREGVAKALEELPDLIIWDVMLPEVDGYNAFREVRTDPRAAHVPVIILTAKSEMEDLFRQERVDAFLSKPVDIEILLAKARELTGHRMARDVAPVPLDLGRVRVLMVDDDPTFIRLMEGYMQKIGCRGMVCRNGREALDLLKVYNFDICFMDIMMPEMNGVEAAGIIREEFSRKLPIIAITSSAMKATKDKCLEVGMNDFVAKPVSIENIRDFINRYALRGP